MSWLGEREGVVRLLNRSLGRATLGSPSGERTWRKEEYKNQRGTHCDHLCLKRRWNGGVACLVSVCEEAAEGVSRWWAMRLRTVWLSLGSHRKGWRSSRGWVLWNILSVVCVLHVSRLRGRGENSDNRDFHIYHHSFVTCHTLPNASFQLVLSSLTTRTSRREPISAVTRVAVHVDMSLPRGDASLQPTRPVPSLLDTALHSTFREQGHAPHPNSMGGYSSPQCERMCIKGRGECPVLRSTPFDDDPSVIDAFIRTPRRQLAAEER